MKFPTPNHVLLWYCNKDWLHPPHLPGNHSPLLLGGSIRNTDPEDVFDTFIRITNTLRILTHRELRAILEGFVRNAGPHKWGISERRVRQIKHDAVLKLTPMFESAGLLFEGKFEAPKLLPDSDEIS